jgi:hypothetical protein
VTFIVVTWNLYDISTPVTKKHNYPGKSSQYKDRITCCVSGTTFAAGAVDSGLTARVCAGQQYVSCPLPFCVMPEAFLLRDHPSDYFHETLQTPLLKSSKLTSYLISSFRLVVNVLFFLCVIPQGLNFMCRRFGTFHTA